MPSNSDKILCRFAIDHQRYPCTVYAVKYGKILTELAVMQIQLTINLVALVVAFMAAMTTANSDKTVCCAVSVDHQSGGTSHSLRGSHDNSKS